MKPPRKTHVRRFLQNGVGRGYIVAVTERLYGNYAWVYVSITGSTWRLLEGCRVHPVTATYIQTYNCLVHPVKATYIP